jgi:hypothetical protein
MCNFHKSVPVVYHYKDVQATQVQPSNYYQPLPLPLRCAGFRHALQHVGLQRGQRQRQLNALRLFLPAIFCLRDTDFHIFLS